MPSASWQIMLATIMNTDPAYATPRRQPYPSSVRPSIPITPLLFDPLTNSSVSGFILGLRPRAGLYLTDVTFCREGNPSHRASPKNPEKKLLNFNKYHKLARIVQGEIVIYLILFS